MKIEIQLSSMCYVQLFIASLTTIFVMIIYVYRNLKTLWKMKDLKKINNILGIGIPGLLIKIVSCFGFDKNKKKTFIMSCCIKLVS